MKCIFCDIIDNKKPAFKVWENNDFLAFLDVKPINLGHILLIPKNHQEEIFNLEDNLYNKLFETIKKLSKPLKKITKAKRIGIAIEGLGVPHAHIHLVPIYHGNELNPERAKKVSENELEQMQKIFVKDFSRIK